MASCRLIEDGPSQELKDITHVHITATVKSDDRVSYEAAKQESAASSQSITHTVKKKSFRWVKRHSSSAYSDEGTGVVRNDAAGDGPMEKTASKLREHSESMGSGVSFTIPWMEFSYRVGDRVTGLSGRDIELPTKPGEEPSFPMVARVTYDFRGQRTGLWLRSALKRG